MRNVRSLLAPAGVLVLIEETALHRVFELNMGLQSGFERFEDYHLRPRHPLLSSEQWRTTLLAHGFEDVAIVNESGSAMAFLGFEVIFARGPASVKRFDDKGLRHFLRQKLPDSMVPSTFVALDALPLTANGKLDRAVLPAPDRQRRGPDRPFVAPRNPTEERVAAVWEQVLGIEHVGVDDNFFEIGGDSLLAVQLVGALQATFQVELSVTHLFTEQTVTELSLAIEELIIDQLLATSETEQTAALTVVGHVAN